MEYDSKTMKQCSSTRIPHHSQLHPVIPRLYVPEWKTDMKNRKLLIQNAELGGVPHFEHDDNLFLEKREQMSYNVEDRQRVDSKYTLPLRADMLNPPHHHHTARYRSSLRGHNNGEGRQKEMLEEC